MHRPTLTWFSATVASVITLLVLLLVFLYVPQWILNGLTVPARSVRVWLASGWVALAFVAVCIIAWRGTPTRGSATA